MIQASGRPSALVDWNNNYADDPDKCVLFHCSNFPQELFGKKGVMDYQEIIAGTVGRENTYGTMAGRLAPTAFTYCRVSTDDEAGGVRAYVGEGELTRDPLTTFGGYGVARIPHLQGLLRHICTKGFEHHVAINPRGWRGGGRGLHAVPGMGRLQPRPRPRRTDGRRRAWRKTR